ncbi:glucosaminidase domain-containing protein [Vibrio salinus]|uniref:glucosaminidase domain-containing protein n=1 Tax=Vibrio salinus TaxID=2899784 RepID=UPI001E4447FE|nr:glucosaminidase domain-containing protein [Vibrio salinus]MCE0492533.1 glucosaminidase domain-containing protein [Vibrio salinus]
MRKYWIIYTIFSATLIGCTFTQYQLSLNNKNQPKQDVASGHEIGEAPKFKEIKKISERKKAFFRYLIPGVEFENSEIKQERNKILALQKKVAHNKLNTKELTFLKKLAKKYRVKSPDSDELTKQWLEQLLVKVDVLPVPLVLIQAANESAWGTSRFAREGNNYFGQWCYRKGCGLVPLARNEGMIHEVAKFASVQQSIHYYFLNVNRNKAYAELRKLRANRRSAGLSMVSEDASFDVTNGLVNYSEKGQLYVDILQSMLKHNSKYWNLPK